MRSFGRFGIPVMSGRGFFAELEHQALLARRAQQRNMQAELRQHRAAIREAEQARRLAERMQTQVAKSAEAERKRLEKEQREAYLASREDEVAEKNEALVQINEEVDSLLSSALKVDSHIDLASLRVKAVHPPFGASSLETPIPMPPWIPDALEPTLLHVEPPSGLGKWFGQKSYEEALERARRAHDFALDNWRAANREIKARRQQAVDAHAVAERERLVALTTARQHYDRECVAREAEASVHNERLEELITNLGYGTADAIVEYMMIVFANSPYPDHFEIFVKPEFEPSTAELGLRTFIPAPSQISQVKSYKFVRSSDEIVSVAMSQKESRDRYNAAVYKVALRCLHEAFEADRRSMVRTISIEVGANTLDPATGQPTYIPFVIAAAERDSFTQFDLSAVVPALTLAKLGAAISRNPYDLAPVERAGVRRS